MNLVTKTFDNAKVAAYGDVIWPIDSTVIIRVWGCKDTCLIKGNHVKGPQFYVTWVSKQLSGFVW